MLKAISRLFNAAAAAITGGTIDGTVIGGTTPAAGTFTTLTSTDDALLNGAVAAGTGFGLVVAGGGMFRSFLNGGPGISAGASSNGYGEVGYNVDFQSANAYEYIVADTAGSIQFAGANILVKGAGAGAAGDPLTFTNWGSFNATSFTGAPAVAIPAGGTTGAGLKVSTTANFGVFFGSGVPTLAAAKGSLYLRSDGSTTNDRMYVNTNGGTTWTAVTTAA